MIEFLNNSWSSILELGLKHNVNPLLFAFLYVSSIPPYLGSMVWIARNYKAEKSLTIPIISTLFFFILPALYVLIFGRNVAWWVYLILLIMIGYGSFSAYQKVKENIAKS